jgi:hypothetical protein
MPPNTPVILIYFINILGGFLESVYISHHNTHYIMETCLNGIISSHNFFPDFCIPFRDI